MEALIKDIKKLAEEQINLKDQRKTVHNKLPRKIAPWEATLKHQVNREKLRVMYAALGVLRGKKFSEIENSYEEEDHPLYQYENRINKLIETYKNAEALRASE